MTGTLFSLESYFRLPDGATAVQMLVCIGAS